MAAAEAVFRQEAASLGDSRCVWHAEVGFPTKILVRHASEADLVIAGRNVEGETEETHVGTADLIMISGLPLLAVPAGAKFDLRRILVGWKDTREARRAVGDALPLLKRATKVHVVNFDSDVTGISKIAARLKLHDVAVGPRCEARRKAPCLKISSPLRNRSMPVSSSWAVMVTRGFASGR